MTVEGWIWLATGWIPALAAAIAWERFERSESERRSGEGDWVPGIVFVVVWVMAPFAMVIAGFLAVVAAISWGTRRVNGRLGPTRAQMECDLARVRALNAHLEHAMGLHVPEGGEWPPPAGEIVTSMDDPGFAG